MSFDDHTGVQDPHSENIDHGAVGQSDQILGLEPEYCIRCAGGCPQLVERQQIAVDEGHQRLRMPTGRNAADREPGCFANEIRRSLSYRLSKTRGDGVLIDTVHSARDHQNGPTGNGRLEYDGLGNLCDGAADGLGGLDLAARDRLEPASAASPAVRVDAGSSTTRQVRPLACRASCTARALCFNSLIDQSPLEV